MTWLATVIEVLPKLRTKFQLSGLVVALAAVVATRAVAPQAVNAQLSAGAIGVLFIVFGQVFSSLKDFPERERSRLVLLLFGIFCVFIVTLVIVTGFFVARADSTPITEIRVPSDAIVWRDNYQLLLDVRLSGGCSDGPQAIDKHDLYDVLDRLDLVGEPELQSFKAEIVSMEKSQIATDKEKNCLSAAIGGDQLFLRADVLSKLRALIRGARRRALSERVDVEALEQPPHREPILF
jgi:hypothetical protein